MLLIILNTFTILFEAQYDGLDIAYKAVTGALKRRG